MADTNEKYLSLITSEYAEKPLFNEYVKAFLDMISPIVDCFNDFQLLFELDNAVGDQLDKIGIILNMSRELPIDDPNIPQVLPDDLFRLVLKSRILANYWDGTMGGLKGIISTVFPSVAFEIVDNQDMTIGITMITSQTDTVLSLLVNGYIISKPAGVKVNFDIQEAAYFGWDSDSAFIKGWDNGIWSNT